jgi:soluble lytic murein transglycosylase-like protein
MSLLADVSAILGRMAALEGTAAPNGVAASIPSAPATASADPHGRATFEAMLAEALGRLGILGEGATGNGAAIAVPGELEPFISRSANAYGVNPNLVKAVIANESGYRVNAVSPVGAQGLMQLMPDTAASLGVGDPFEASQNIAGGTRYLRGLYDRFDDWKLAVAAYNAGPGAVMKYGGVPPYRETEQYVANVMESYNHYRAVQ